MKHLHAWPGNSLNQIYIKLAHPAKWRPFWLREPASSTPRNALFNARSSAPPSGAPLRWCRVALLAATGAHAHEHVLGRSWSPRSPPKWLDVWFRDRPQRTAGAPALGRLDSLLWEADDGQQYS